MLWGESIPGRGHMGKLLYEAVWANCSDRWFLDASFSSHDQWDWGWGGALLSGGTTRS